MYFSGLFVSVFVAEGNDMELYPRANLSWYTIGEISMGVVRVQVSRSVMFTFL